MQRDYEERILFESPMVRIGSFRLRPSYPSFRDTGPIHDYLIVFPRTTVRITHEGHDPVVSDPGTVMFYNRAQRYHRDKISERGDLCEWFAFDTSAIVDSLRPIDPAVQDRSERLFSWTHGPSDSRAYWTQRRIVEGLQRGAEVDALWVEETMLDVLGAVARNASAADPVRTTSLKAATRRQHRELAQRAKAALGASYRQNLTLAEISRAVGGSPYHLSRVFRRETGHTLHAHRNQIRLHSSLEQLLGGRRDLAALAIDLGFSHHSHFSQAFRRFFGVPPSEARGRLLDPAVESSKNLTARIH